MPNPENQFKSGDVVFCSTCDRVTGDPQVRKCIIVGFSLGRKYYLVCDTVTAEHLSAKIEEMHVPSDRLIIDDDYTASSNK